MAAWNEQGLRWREWTATELVWILHRRNIAIIAAETPSQMRKYLNATHDDAYLRVWDNERMADKHSDQQ